MRDPVDAVTVLECHPPKSSCPCGGCPGVPFVFFPEAEIVLSLRRLSWSANVVLGPWEKPGMPISLVGRDLRQRSCCPAAAIMECHYEGSC